jgi:hypothetical protein
MLRLLTAGAIAAFLLGGVARAQTPSVPPQAPSGKAQAAPAADPSRADRYVEGAFGWTFGDKGSQYFGGEGGFALKPNLHIFVEAGQVLDAGDAAVRDAAQTVAEGLARTQSGVTYDAKQPTTYVSGGIRYQVAVSGSHVQPFVLAGGGMAHVKQDVAFMINGSDVTSSLAQYGVVLGSDLSGSFSKGEIVFGGGLVIPFHNRLMLEIGYRGMKIFSDDGGITINRAGFGFGTRF